MKRWIAAALFLLAGPCAFTAGLFTLAQAQAPSIRSVILDKRPAVSVVNAGSTWGDHGTNVTISTTTIANDTATGVANSYSMVRGTQAYSTGKHYFEIRVLIGPAVANLMFGLADDTTPAGAPLDTYSFFVPNSIGHNMFDGNAFTNGADYNGSNIGSGWPLVDNDVMSFALDQDNGFYYLAKNNTWFLSGNPTSGATGTGAVGNGLFTAARPMLTLWGIPLFSGTHQLITTTSAFTYSPPTGYSAWNYLLRRDVFPNAVNDDNTPMWMNQAA